jgi:hypothetical protein
MFRKLIIKNEVEWLAVASKLEAWTPYVLPFQFPCIMSFYEAIHVGESGPEVYIDNVNFHYSTDNEP